MILFLSITGVFLSILLIYFNVKSYRTSLYLGLFFLLISLYGLFQYILLFSNSEFWITVFLLLIPILGTTFYLIGPVLFLYVRSVISDNHRLKKTDWWHLLPAIIFFVSALPDLFTPISIKFEAAAAIAQNTDEIGNYHPTLLSALISYPALFLSRPLLILGYTVSALILLAGYMMNPDKKSVFTGLLFMPRWLAILLGSMLFLLVSHILLLFDFTTGKLNLIFLLETLRVISVVSLTGLLISPFFFPGILYGLPRLPETGKISGKNRHEPLPPTHNIPAAINPAQETTPVLTLHVEKSKPAPPVFESEYIGLIDKRTEECMQEFQPYLQQDFNLAQLSVLLKIPAHHLAYYFREVKQMSFTDFRNRRRVEHAKKLIREGKSTDLTLEAIGILSGFSSRNTFLTAFKKAEGITPNDFRTQITQS
jgi:AraC-like DNA-binding protein